MAANQRYRKPLPGTDLEYYDARAACEDIKPGSYDKLPYTSRILAENLVNRADKVDLPTLQSWLGQLIEGKQEIDFPWYPARVVCHDILGQTALVDLAGLRDAIAEKGGDPAKVNPVVQTQLIVDHSLAVECGGYDPDAFRKNRQIEDRRNEDRFHFINWTKTAFENVDVIPAGNGIMHQINLEKMSPVVQVKNGVAFPDTCVGTDSHTPHVDALGVISVGVGGLEAETVMLGRASMMRLPDIVGVELNGKRQAGITATDIVLALTEFLRKERVVGAFVEFFGEGARSLSIGDRATISNMTPEFGATAAMFAIDEQTIDYLKLTGRDDAQVKLVETYAKTAGLWADALKTAVYPRVLKFDLSSVTRNMAGPSNPHARFATADLASKGLAKPYEEPSDGQMPDGAVIIADYQLHQHFQPAQRCCRRALGAQRQLLRAETQTVGQNLVCPRFESGGNLFERSRPAARNGKTRLRYRRLRLHHLQRHEWRAGSENPERNHRPRFVRHRRIIRQPQLRRPCPSVCETGFPRFASVGRCLRAGRQYPFRY